MPLTTVHSQGDTDTSISKKSEVVPYSIMSVGHGADPGFLSVINLVVGCHYFPPGLQLLSLEQVQIQIIVQMPQYK